MVAALFIPPRPPPITTPTPAPPPSSIDDTIRIAATQYGVSYALLSCIAWRESTGTPGLYDARAVSATEDFGLFQFHRPWDADSLWQQTPYADGDPFDAETSANAAAWAISRGYGPRWSVWRLCI